MNGFWVLSDEALVAMLREVQAGAEPDEVMIEHYVNAEDHQSVGDASTREGEDSERSEPEGLPGAPTRPGSATSPTPIEQYILDLPWTEHATDDEKVLVAGNIRAFAAWWLSPAPSPGEAR